MVGNPGSSQPSSPRPGQARPLSEGTTAPCPEPHCRSLGRTASLASLLSLSSPLQFAVAGWGGGITCPGMVLSLLPASPPLASCSSLFHHPPFSLLPSPRPLGAVGHDPRVLYWTRGEGEQRGAAPDMGHLHTSVPGMCEAV